RGDPIELLPNVGADAEAERVELVLFLDSVMEDGNLRRGLVALAGEDRKGHERVAVERREQQVAHTDVELDRLDVGIALGDRSQLLLFDEERADEAAAKVGQREALRLEVALDLRRPDDEVDQCLIGAPAIDRQRGDASPDDDREREEALADDLAESLKAPDA